MAIMSAVDRDGARQEFTAAVGTNRETIGIDKAALLSAVGAVDQWVSDNVASFNSALPVAARNALSSAQKARLLSLIVARRFLAGV